MKSMRLVCFAVLFAVTPAASSSKASPETIGRVLQTVGAQHVGVPEDFWQSADVAARLHRCFEPGVCLGGSICRQDRTGPMCTRCVEQEYAAAEQPVLPGSFGGECHSCSQIDEVDGWGALISVMVLASLIAIPWSVLYSTGSTFEDCTSMSLTSDAVASEAAVDALAHTTRGQVCVACHIILHGLQLAALAIDAARVLSPGGLKRDSDLTQSLQNVLALVLLDARPLRPECVLGVESFAHEPSRALVLSWLLPVGLSMSILVLTMILRVLWYVLRRLLAHAALRRTSLSMQLQQLRESRSLTGVISVLPASTTEMDNTSAMALCCAGSVNSETSGIGSDAAPSIRTRGVTMEIRSLKSFTSKATLLRTKSSLVVRAATRKTREWTSLCFSASPLLSQPLSLRSLLQAIRILLYLFSPALMKLTVAALECGVQPDGHSLAVWPSHAGPLESCSERRLSMLVWVCPLLVIYVAMPLAYFIPFFCGGVARAVERFEEQQERARLARVEQMRSDMKILEDEEAAFPEVFEDVTLRASYRPSLLLLQVKPEKWLWPIAVLIRNGVCGMSVAALGCTAGGTPSLWLMFLAQLLYTVWLLRKWPWATPRLNILDTSVSVSNLVLVLLSCAHGTLGAAEISGHSLARLTTGLLQVSVLALLVLVAFVTLFLVVYTMRQKSNSEVEAVERKDFVDKMDLAADLMKLALQLCAVDHGTYRTIINTFGREERNSIHRAIRLVQEHIDSASAGGVVDLQRRQSFQRITKEWMKQFQIKGDAEEEEEPASNSQDLGGLEFLFGPSRKGSTYSSMPDTRKAAALSPASLSPSLHRHDSNASLASMRDILGWRGSAAVSPTGPQSPVQGRSRVQSVAFMKTWGHHGEGPEEGSIADLPGGLHHSGHASPQGSLHHHRPLLLPHEATLSPSHRHQGTAVNHLPGIVDDDDLEDDINPSSAKAAWAGDEDAEAKDQHLPASTQAEAATSTLGTLDDAIRSFEQDVDSFDGSPSSCFRSAATDQEDSSPSLSPSSYGQPSPKSGEDMATARQRWLQRRAKKQAQRRTGGKVNYGNMLRQMHLDGPPMLPTGSLGRNSSGTVATDAEITPASGRDEPEAADGRLMIGGESASSSRVASPAREEFSDPKEYQQWTRRGARKLHERYHRRDNMRDEERSNSGSPQELNGLRQCIVDQLPNLSHEPHPPPPQADSSALLEQQFAELGAGEDSEGVGLINSALPDHSGLSTVAEEVSRMPSRDPSKGASAVASAVNSSSMPGRGGRGRTSLMGPASSMGSQRDNKRASIAALSQDLENLGENSQDLSSRPDSSPCHDSAQDETMLDEVLAAVAEETQEDDDTEKASTGNSEEKQEVGKSKTRLSFGGEEEVWFDDTVDKSVGMREELVKASAELSAYRSSRMDRNQRSSDPEEGAKGRRPSIMQRLRRSSIEAFSFGMQGLAGAASGNMAIEARRKQQIQAMLPVAHRRGSIATGSRVGPSRPLSTCSPSMSMAHSRASMSRTSMASNSSADPGGIASGDWLLPQESMLRFVASQAYKSTTSTRASQHPSASISLEQAVHRELHENASSPASALLNPGLDAMLTRGHPEGLGVESLLDEMRSTRSADSDNTVATAQLIASALDEIARDKQVGLADSPRHITGQRSEGGASVKLHPPTAETEPPKLTGNKKGPDGSAVVSPPPPSLNSLSPLEAQSADASAAGAPSHSLEDRMKQWKERKDRKQQKRKEARDQSSARKDWNRTYGSMVHLEAKKQRSKSSHSAAADADGSGSDDASSAYSGRSTGSSNTLSRAAPASMVSNRLQGEEKPSFPAATDAETTTHRRWCSSKADK